MKSKFYLHSKANSQGEKSIYLRINMDYKQSDLRTKEKVLPKYWDIKKQRVKSTNAFELGYEINIRLSQIEEVANNIYQRYLSEHKEQPEIKYLKKIIEYSLFGGDDPDKKYNLINYFEEFNDSLGSKLNSETGRPLNKQYIGSLKLTLKKLKQFIKQSNQSVEFEDINAKFYDDFIQYLNKFDYKTNYIGKQIKNLKTVLNSATIKGINFSLQFKAFREVTEDVSSLALTENEISQLYNLDLSYDPKLEKTRDLFVVGCYTGLRFSDLKRFNDNAIIKGDLIDIKAQKTQTYITIPIHPITRKIIVKYQNKLPFISEPKFNKNIKKIAKLVSCLQDKIQREFTRGSNLIIETKPKWQLIQSHTARRSFATNMFKRSIPVETIMAITGHKKTSTFYKYIHLPPDYHARHIANIFNQDDLGYE